MPATKPKISALGCFVPPGILTNSDLEKMVKTSNDWILDRTGISERWRRGARSGNIRSGYIRAAQAALRQRGIEV